MADDDGGPSLPGPSEWRGRRYQPTHDPTHGELLDPVVDRRSDDGPRRRWWMVALVAVVVVVAGGLAIDRATTGSSSGPDGGDGQTIQIAPALTAGSTRTVTLAGVSVTVPYLWVDRPDPDPRGWCLATGLPQQTPYVSNGRTENTGAHCPLGTSDAPAGFPEAPETTWVTHLSLTRLAAEAESVRDGTTTYDGWTLTTRTVDDVVVRLLTEAGTADAVGPIMASVSTG